jgi:hypothetical protein
MMVVKGKGEEDICRREGKGEAEVSATVRLRSRD